MELFNTKEVAQRLSALQEAVTVVQDELRGLRMLGLAMAILELLQKYPLCTAIQVGIGEEIEPFLFIGTGERRIVHCSVRLLPQGSFVQIPHQAVPASVIGEGTFVASREDAEVRHALALFATDPQQGARVLAGHMDASFEVFRISSEVHIVPSTD